MTPASEPAPTVTLADRLAARRPAILSRWRAAVDADPVLTAPASPSRQALTQHIPRVLDDLERILRAVPASTPTGGAGGEAATPDGHGDRHHRWSQGHDLREAILEWGHFQRAVHRTLEECRPEIDPATDPAALAAAHAELARMVNEGIADSVEQHARFQAAEATEHVHALEFALAKFSAAGRRRVDSWREASHDLRGQLNIIVSATALLDDPTLIGPMRDESFEMLKKGVRSLHKMLVELLESARQEANGEGLNVERFDAGALLGNLCAAAQPLARERGLRLIAEGPGDLPVEGDRGKVQRIVQNLLLNALRYTERGEVTLRWHGDDAETWSFQVRDTGPGLPDSARTALLERESRAPGTFPGRPAPPAPPPAPGEGIGLSIVRRLGNVLGARVRVESTPEGGTDFRVALPRFYRVETGT